MISIVRLDSSAGVMGIAGRHSGDRTVGIAERCGVRHGLRRQDRIMRFVSAQVLLERGVMMGLAMFLVGFVYTLYLLLKWIGSGYMDLPVLDQDIAGLTLLVIGLETIFYPFFLSVIGGGE